ncbi:hypothetical protein H632_c1128p0 [Helicosporidium sp. ATCC 50920]|nr:hypothetical protein H632_c1128p0 [Helicosporidium sp. ATCC 50920]|eukprot:KDD74694.1 hypothetical protein H632_c1128p0 [Helicosporidium sp. ATCC 50920]
MADYNIRRSAGSPEDLAFFRSNTRELVEQLGEDLSFQSIEEELCDIPGKYAEREGGFILIAEHADGRALGAVAVRPLPAQSSPSTRACEMKRLFVPPRHQGRGLGRALAERALKEAQLSGYGVMFLDTLTRLAPANKLYSVLGFEAVEPYNYNPIPDVRYFSRRL